MPPGAGGARSPGRASSSGRGAAGPGKDGRKEAAGAAGDAGLLRSPRMVDPELRHLVDADGSVDQLFFHLWKKNRAGHNCPGVRVPETIVYKYSLPHNWFFMSVDGPMKKKNKKNTNHRNIGEKWLQRKRNEPLCSIVASYMWTQESKREGGKVQDGKTTIEYMDAEGLHAFLKSGERASHGVLQKFVYPKDGRNLVIRASWSPSICLLERRINNHHINDHRVPLDERISTFEGAEHLSKSVPIVNSGYLARQAQAICNSIVDHIAEISSGYNRISRMVVDFKVDEKNRLWLLSCSSIRMRNQRDPLLQARTGINLDPAYKVKRKARRANPDMTDYEANYFQCPNCSKIYTVKMKCEVTFKSIILRKAKTSPHGSDAPPALLRKIDRGVNEGSYSILKTDPAFLYQNADVCEKCCLSITSTVMADLETENPSAYRGPGSYVPKFPKPITDEIGALNILYTRKDNRRTYFRPGSARPSTATGVARSVARPSRPASAALPKRAQTADRPTRPKAKYFPPKEEEVPPRHRYTIEDAMSAYNLSNADLAQTSLYKHPAAARKGGDLDTALTRAESALLQEALDGGGG